MADSSGLVVAPAGEVVGTGDITPECKGKVGERDSPKIRRSERKRPLRSISGHLLKSRPKSPMLRMAEMRRGGLRGGALRLTSLKGSVGSEMKVKKARKGVTGSGSQSMASDLESSGTMEVLMKGSNAKGSADEVFDDLPMGGCRGFSGEQMGMGVSQILEGGPSELESGVPGEAVVLSSKEEEAGVMLGQVREMIPLGESSDCALDLISVQPLQEMVFVAEQVVSAEPAKVGSPVVDSVMVEVLPELVNGGSVWDGIPSVSLKGGPRADVEFPILSKEGLKAAKEMNKSRGLAGIPVEGGPSVVVQGEGLKEGSRGGYGGNKGFGGKNYKNSVMEGVRTGANSPVSFEPDKIKKIGISGTSAGLPSIYFSGSDTSFLAEKLGFAVVGKFSHSIPSSLSIQKSLQGMRFIGEFSWRYINAKHILIQFKLVADYAKLLSGPSGMPVWFIDRHPMRVFKWSPEFDPFFESPIAAVWCNLIGLPIHLFEKSVLFAIGSLLGEPLQVDHATISRSRLSFARLCIEIDISKPPVEEIILDLQGRIIKQAVKWDRIPLYCRECKHVGHISEACYANGLRVKPARRDYNHMVEQGSWAGKGVGEGKGGGVADGPQGGQNQGSGVKEAGVDGGLLGGKDQGGGVKEAGDAGGLLGGNGQGSGVKEAGAAGVLQGGGLEFPGSQSSRSKDSLDPGPLVHEDGEFQFQGRRRGKQGRGAGGSRAASAERGQGGAGVGDRGGGSRFPSPDASRNRFALLSSSALDLAEGSLGGLVKPRYYKVLSNGDFDSEAYEDEKDWEMEEESEADPGLQLSILKEKRGVSEEFSDPRGEESKKERLESGPSSSTV